MIKLIALDIDGTLVNEKKIITPKVKKSIFKAQDKGIKIVLCTGRPLKGLENQIQELELEKEENYIIANTGSYIHNSKTGEAIDKVFLNSSDYYRLEEETKKCNIQLTAYTATELWNPNEHPNKASLKDSAILSMPVSLLTRERLEAGLEIARINIMGYKEDVDRALKELSPEIYEDYYTVRNETFSFEVLQKKAGKGNALRRLANLLNIDSQEIMGIGDGYNDLDMIKYAGYGIAMGNGVDAVKEASSFVTKSNEDDGVAYAIEKFVIKDL